MGNAHRPLQKVGDRGANRDEDGEQSPPALTIFSGKPKRKLGVKRLNPYGVQPDKNQGLRFGVTQTLEK